jgi:hypothetical protein
MEIESTAVRSEFMPLFSRDSENYKKEEHQERQSLELNGTKMRAVQTSKPSNEKDTLDHICLKGSKAELPS